MAVVTGIAAGNMSSMLARSGNAVMARIAGADYLSVVNRKCGCEYIGAMAIFTDVAG